MNGLSIEELITKAHEEKVRIEVEITPDEYGHVTQRITIEPWEQFDPKCPYGTPVVYVKGKKEDT